MSEFVAAFLVWFVCTVVQMCVLKDVFIKACVCLVGRMWVRLSLY